MALSIPDRFEILAQDTKNLDSIILPVEAALNVVDRIFTDMSASKRGSFLLLRGNPGVGKTTFLQTLNLFRPDVVTESISVDSDLRQSLKTIRASAAHLRILIIDGREALGDTSSEQLETAIHQINSFLRSPKGRNTLVVWPCNTDSLQQRIVGLAAEIGGDALTADVGPVYVYPGPSKPQFRQIAQSTIATLNNGANFLDLGISDSDLEPIIEKSETIGGLMGAIRRLALTNSRAVAQLAASEQCKLWILVAAGSEPSSEVAALTRGSNSFVDIDRLVAATEANIVHTIKQHPHRVGVVANSFDTRIFHLPVLTALAATRSFYDEALKAKMQLHNLSTNADRADALERLSKTDLATAFRGQNQGLNSKGRSLGPNTVKSFESLSEIAADNDLMLNAAIARALQAAGFIDSFQLEQDFGKGLTRRTDIVAQSALGRIRFEVMWRRRTSRAEIANYVLQKIWQYGQALGAI